MNVTTTIFQKLAKYEHKTLSCEACHGAGQAHADNPDVKMVKCSATAIACAATRPILRGPSGTSRSASKDHYPGHKCTECHVPHNPSEVP